MSNFFKVLHKSAKSKARLGEITTYHGIIKTPAFAPCATKGTLKTLLPSLIKEIGIQTAFVNTYHLVTHPGVDIIEKAGGIHEFSRLNIPLMSDSGGFQVFSLARNNKVRHHPAEREVSSLSGVTRKADIRGEEEPLLVKISEDGVKFRSTYDGQLIEFTPEKSMEFQRKIGADINMAFDECTYYGSTYEYSKKAIERTHHWLLRSIGQYQKSNIKNQKLYGIIQGGIYEDLRKKSAEFVVSQNTPGVAIGGVSVGETKKVKWVSDYLPKDRPVHLLGIGQIDDIIDLVKYGIDSFDCSEPTRLARMGVIYKIFNFQFSIFNETLKNKIFKQENLDITRTIYRNNLEKVDVNCNCYVCNNFTKSYLHHLFKQKEILGYTLATYHNLWVMEKLFDRIREAIGKNII
jgi:tRNA-guanine transglycosylase